MAPLIRHYCCFAPEKGSPGRYWIRGWVVSRVCLDAVGRDKCTLLPEILPGFRGRAARGVDTVLTELSFSVHEKFYTPLCFWTKSVSNVSCPSAIFLNIIHYYIKGSVIQRLPLFEIWTSIGSLRNVHTVSLIHCCCQLLWWRQQLQLHGVTIPFYERAASLWRSDRKCVEQWRHLLLLLQ